MCYYLFQFVYNLCYRISMFTAVFNVPFAFRCLLCGIPRKAADASSGMHKFYHLHSIDVVYLALSPKLAQFLVFFLQFLVRYFVRNAGLILNCVSIAHEMPLRF